MPENRHLQKENPSLSKLKTEANTGQLEVSNTGQDIGSILQRIQVKSDTLTRSDVIQLQRTLGNQQTQHILANRQQIQPQPQPTIQRMVMTDKQFEDSLSGFSFRRSAEMVAIQQALMIYNKAGNAKLDERFGKLNDILNACQIWKRKKDASDKGQQGKQAENIEAVRKLVARVLQEQKILTDQQQKKPDLSKPEGIRTELIALFDAAAKQTRAALAITTGSLGGIGATLARLKDEASTLEKQTSGMNNTAEGKNTIRFAQITVQAIEMLNTIAEACLTKNARAMEKIRTDRFKLIIFFAFVEGTDKDPGNKAVFDEAYNKMRTRTFDYISIAEDRLGAKSKGKQPDTAILEGSLDVVGKGTELTGLYGTTGADNSGGMVKGGFDSGMSDSQKNTMSGVSDVTGHMAGHVGDTVALVKALETLDDPDASEEDKRNAHFTVAKYPTQIVEHTSAMIGGGWTALKQDGATLPESNFGFDPQAGSGTDISTDVKMVGDFAGWFTGMISTIQDTVNFVKYLDGSERSEKDDMSSTRKTIERVGNVVSQASGIGVNLTKSYRAASLIANQIKDAGQTSAQTAVGLLPKEVVPALGIVTGSIDLIHNGYKLWRIGMRRSSLTEKIGETTVGSDLGDVQALEFAHESLVKRTVRLGKNIAHAILSIVSSALTVSGIAAPAGMAIGIAQAAEKLGAIAFRKAKQYARDKKAEKREEKDKERGFTETYQEWELRKQLEAAKEGRGTQFLTAIDIFFTRNWDKSTVKKEEATRDAALHILDMNDDVVYDALGVTKAVKDPKKSYQEKLDIVIAALKKRD